MYPGPIVVFGSPWAPWNLIFLAGVIAGYFVLKATLRRFPTSRHYAFLPLRYTAMVYICTLGAQWFAYAFDAGTTILPPDGFTAFRYYLHPLAGPKTLYGAILALPLAVTLSFNRPSDGTSVTTLDRMLPTLMTILGTSRVGCFLQGCCYGSRSDRFGMRFPPGSSVHGQQLQAGLVGAYDSSLPVLPLQIVEAAFCFLLVSWSWRALRRGDPNVFITTLIFYSAFRFLIEFLRADPARNYYGLLSTSQWVAVILLGGVAAWRLSPSRSLGNEL